MQILAFFALWSEEAAQSWPLMFLFLALIGGLNNLKQRQREEVKHCPHVAPDYKLHLIGSL